MSGEYYGYENEKVCKDNESVSNQSAIEKFGPDHGLNDDNLSASSSNGSTFQKNLQKRQNPQNINHILTGITNSVNRLSELHTNQLPDTPNRVATKKNPSNRYCNDALSNGSLSGQLEQRKNSETVNLHMTSSTRSIGKAKNIKRKLKDAKSIRKQNSQMFIKKNMKFDKKTKVSKSIEDSSRRLPLVEKSSKIKLVEIFHNQEAKSSDSDVGQIAKKTRQVNCDGDHLDVVNADVPLLHLDSSEEVTDVNAITKRPVPERQTGDYYDPPEAPRMLLGSRPKSYLLPTIASRMKQSMVNTFISTNNFINGGPLIQPKKSIPFCPAITASPSHNIGINIQQVMNILRNRQPINGISPTLAHNIGLAADRLNTKPLSTFVSTIGSKTCYGKPQQCLLSKHNLNYQELQDMAKGIPEETQEEVEGEINSPDVKTMIITGPTGDIEIKTKNVPTWAAESTKSVECTCVPKTGTDIFYIANKIKKAASGKISTQINIDKKLTANFNDWNPIPKAPKRPHTTATKPKVVSKFEPKLDKTASEFPIPINGNEKNLKQVLTHLHKEFEQLNTRYEELCKTTSSSDEEGTKEIAFLEKELNKKEEEITMVMTLCKEILALKNELKSLKPITSQGNVSQESQKSTTDYNNPQAAFHLTKLLKQIKTYQSRYKNIDCE